MFGVCALITKLSTNQVMSEPAANTAAQPSESATTRGETVTQASRTVRLFDTCPPEKTVLRILLVSGQKTDILCNPSDIVETFLLACFNEWPEGT